MDLVNTMASVTVVTARYINMYYFHQKFGFPWNKLPNYTDMKREGSDHDPIFYVEVKLENGLSAIGKDKSKRKAQQNAAQKLLSKIKN